MERDPDMGDTTLSNAQIAATLDQVADLLEFQGANAFRVRAYRRAADALGGDVLAPAVVVTDDREAAVIDALQERGHEVPHRVLPGAKVQAVS